MTPSYFETMGIPINRGRGFAASYERGSSVVISERLANALFPAGNAVGGQVSWSESGSVLASNAESRRVVGVAGDVVCNLGPGRRLMPSIYIPHQATATDALLMAIRARDDMDELALQVRRSVASLDPEGHTILDLRPLSAQRAFFIEREALGAVLVALLASMCLFVTVMCSLLHYRGGEALALNALGRRRMARIGGAGVTGAAIAVFLLVLFGSEASLGLDAVTRSLVRRHYSATSIHVGATLATALLPMFALVAPAIFGAASRWLAQTGLTEARGRI